MSAVPDQPEASARTMWQPASRNVATSRSSTAGLKYKFTAVSRKARPTPNETPSISFQFIQQAVWPGSVPWICTCPGIACNPGAKPLSAIVCVEGWQLIALEVCNELGDDSLQVGLFVLSQMKTPFSKR